MATFLVLTTKAKMLIVGMGNKSPPDQVKETVKVTIGTGYYPNN